MLSLGIVRPGEAGYLNLASNGSLGPSSDYFTQHPNAAYRLDTDDGKIYWKNGLHWEVIEDSAKRVVTQPDPAGTQIVLFDFTSFSVPSTLTRLEIVGSRPAGVLATQGINIAAPVVVTAGGLAGGAGGTATNENGQRGENAIQGGHGGESSQGRIRNADGNYYYPDAGGGGGGAMVSGGGAGASGHALDAYTWNGSQWVYDHTVHYSGGGGGGAAPDLAEILRGGGGGGGGGFAYGANWFPHSGRTGGQGGGAVVFDAAGNIVIEPTGSVSVDGQNGEAADWAEGAGGGGAGGHLAFVSGSTWTNLGSLSARGSAGGNATDDGYGAGGPGSGGRIYARGSGGVSNLGAVDVSDGNGTDILGGEFIAEVTEPATLSLVVFSLLGMGLLARRRKTC